MEYDAFACRLGAYQDNSIFGIDVSRDFSKALEKLSRKDKKTLEATLSKMTEISTQPEHYKPLRGPMKGYWRAHVGSFVVVYSIDKNQRRVAFEKFDHHDSAYN